VADLQLAKRLERIRFHGIEKDAEGNVEVPEWGGKMNLPHVGAVNTRDRPQFSATPRR